MTLLGGSPSALHALLSCPVGLHTHYSPCVPGVGGDFPFNRIHQGGGTFLFAEVRAVAQRSSAAPQEMERKKVCRVARGAQVDNDVAGPSL